MHLLKLPIAAAIIIPAALAQPRYLQKRTSTSIEALANDLQNATATTQQIKNLADAWVAADGFVIPSGVGAILNAEIALKKSLNQSSIDCDNISANFSDTDSSTLLNSISDFAISFQATAQSLIDKKPEFDSFFPGLTDVFIYSQFPQYPPLIKSLDVCFLSHLSSNKSVTAQNYFIQISSTCTDVCTAYNVTCQPPTIN